jgi:hypothetical protein
MMNTRLEEELRNAMQPEDPPDGFLERVLARTAENRQRVRTSIFKWRNLRWAFAGAMCLLLAIAGIEYRRAQEERARGEAAKKQLMLALRIAGSKLQIAQEKIQQSGNRKYQNKRTEN